MTKENANKHLTWSLRLLVLWLVVLVLAIILKLKVALLLAGPLALVGVGYLLFATLVTVKTKTHEEIN